MRGIVIALFCLASVPLMAELGPPIALSKALPDPQAHGVKFAPTIAGNGDGFLAVWLESRGNQRCVIATRITADGKSLDPDGILAGITRSGVVAVVWSGKTWVIAWPVDDALATRRVGADGSLLEKEPVLLRGLAGSGQPYMFSTGSRITFTSAWGYPTVVSTNLDLGDMRRTDTVFDGTDLDPIAAGDGTRVLLAAPVHAARFGSLLEVQVAGETPSEIVRSREIDSLYATFSGGHYWLAWAENQILAPSTAYVQILDRKGRPLGEPIHTSVSTELLRVEPFNDGVVLIGRGKHVFIDQNGHEAPFGDTYGDSLVIAENAAHRAMACWSDYNHVFVASPPAGETHDVSTRRTTQQSSPAGDPSGGTSLVAWSQDDKIFARDLLDGADAFQVTTRNESFAPALAGGDRSTLIACRTFSGAIGTVLLREGAPPSNLSFGVASGSEPPEVVWSGNLYFIFWNEGRKLVLSRMTNDGVRLDKDERVLVTAGPLEVVNSVVAVRGGRQSLLVWQQGPSSDPLCMGTYSLGPCHVYGMRLDAEGNALEQPRLLNKFDEATFMDNAVRPSVTWDGHDFIVIWTAVGDDDGVRFAASGEITQLRLDAGTWPGIAGPVVSRTSVSYLGSETVITVNGTELSRLHTPPVPGRVPHLVPMPRGAIALLYTDARESEGFVPRVFARFVVPPTRSRPLR